MININSYAVTEDYVYRGVSNGVEELLKEPDNFSKPEVVIGKITESVMAYLCAAYDFGSQPVRFTPDILKQIYFANQAKEQKEEINPPKS